MIWGLSVAGSDSNGDEKSSILRSRLDQERALLVPKRRFVTCKVETFLL